MRWLVVVTLVMVGGCSKGPPPPADEKGEGEGAVAEATRLAESAKTIKDSVGDDEKQFDIAGYEKLLVALSACEVGPSGIARECPAWKAFDEIRRDRRTLLRDLTTELAAVGRRHLQDESPAVRLQAARLASSLFGGDQESRDALVAAARVEQNPHVLRAMLRAVRSSIGRSDAVRDLLVQMAKHDDEQVRMTVLGALSAGWADGTEGTLEKVLEAVENDPSPQVRGYACRQLGDRADERALPLLDRLTATPGADEKLYAACFRGLIGMWAAPVPHKAPSEAAYRLTLARLKATPRTEQSPPWGAIANLEWAAKPALATAAPWFDKTELIEALADLAGDRQAHWLARVGAVKVMGRLGARRARLEALQKGYDDVAAVPGVDKHVYDAVVEQIARIDGTIAPTPSGSSPGETIDDAAEAAGVPSGGVDIDLPDSKAAKEAGKAVESAAKGKGKVAAKAASAAVGEAIEGGTDDGKGEAGKKKAVRKSKDNAPR